MTVRLALFDLDHTLIPFDSGGRFMRFLAARGALDPGFEDGYLAHCRRYVEGSVDMVEMHGFIVGPLARHPPELLARWLRDFETALALEVPQAACDHVREHHCAGHLCALVTATTRFIAEPFARVLGLEEVVATEPAIDAAGRYTGAIDGMPCFREHKLAHLTTWLSRRGLAWAQVERSWFYSDSINDLALLEAVSDPVVVDPDPRLRSIAAQRGWPVRSLARDRRRD
jgi:HAD superfamily hydrolase (TIGR01490 family)